eukprot:CAMPEP_0171118190 /NCGR_PEP_ID=MMETSP0766_2-20121228/94196_1 /TAXON_ID=439317 /ORGANISM="Gambierdiscus australes, Strain CAWD 149" /LENGTH=156 /DNA_ID=CAMNT_0011580751 /DNA_START=20 /DNA_END=487 /DNA_ORIENTATION=-
MGERYRVDHRAALFGSRFGASRGPQTPHAESNAAAARAAQAAEVIEQQNDEQLAELGAKVAQLKDITNGIGREVKESNSLLGLLDLNFDKAGGMMKSTLAHLGQVSQRKGGRMCLAVAIFLGLFLGMYLFASLSPRLPGGGDGAVQLWQNSTGTGG